MHSRRIAQYLAGAALATWVTFAALPPSFGQDDATPTPEPEIPQIDRCRRFCAHVYAEGTAEHGECAVACGEADNCMDGCRTRFPENKEKQSGCFKRCMANGRPFEPQPKPNLPQL